MFSNFKGFVRLPKEEKVELLKLDFKDEEIEDIEKACLSFPSYDVTKNLLIKLILL